MATQWTPSQQQAIRLHGQDLLISAAAGSGKTATLTERIIRSLTGTIPDGAGGYLPPADISRMLIVTFTRAAAAELRSRISAALSAAIAAQPDNRHLYRQLLALGSASISTIDSFYLQPVRAHFERLSLPSSFRLADEGELFPIKADTLQHLIDAAYTRHVPVSASPDRPLSVLEGNAFADAMDDLMPNRDRGESTEVLLRLYEKLLAFPEGLEILRLRAQTLQEQAELPFTESDVGKILKAHLCGSLRSIARRIQAACEILTADEVAAQLYLPAALGDLDLVQSLLLRLDTDDWDGAGALLRDYTPMRLGVSKKRKAAPSALEAKELRGEWVKEIRALAPYFDDDDTTRRAHMRQSARCESMLYELLTDYDREIRAIKLRRGVQDFTDVRRALLTLLFTPDGAPSDIALSLREQYDQIYIDEYQDVDTVQDTIFATIGEGGKRFMVGDIKQSIYSFRGAEPSIFAAYRKRFTTLTPDGEPPAGDSGACLFMSENFRCDPCVIDFTNAVCGYAFEACTDSIGYRRDDDLICGKHLSEGVCAQPVRLVILETPPKGEESEEAEEVLTPPADKCHPEAVYLAGEIARLIREETLDDGTPIRPRHIAVLMRATDMADDVAAALAAYGIDTTHTAATSLATHPDMIALVNLLSVIDNPRDDVPLSALLTEESSPLSLQELLLLRTADPACTAIPLFDVLCLAASGEPPLADVAPALQARCADLVAFIRRWQAVAQTLPVDKLLRKLYGEPSLRDKASSPVYLTLYDRARHYQNASFCGLYQFLQYFRRLLEKPDSLSSGGTADTERDAVTLLSIHKSKGLEFPVVFVVNCAAPFSTQDFRSPITFDHTLGAAARVYLPDAGERHESVVRRAIAEQLRVRQTEEEMRILYVAMTRARERLYLTASLRSRAIIPMQRAARATRGDRFAILDTTNYLGWILSAISPANCTADLSSCYRLEVLDRRLYTAAALPATPPPLQPIAAPTSTSDTTDPPPRPGSAAYYRDILRAHQAWSDPHALLRTLPTKAAASKLTYDLLDRCFLPEQLSPDETAMSPVPAPEDKRRDEARYLASRIELLRAAKTPFSELLQTRQQASAAERGTATHLFLQYCDHHALAADGVEAEIERLVQQRYLTPHTAAILNRRHLQAFAKSELLMHALRAKTVYRELQFNRFLPYHTLTARSDIAASLGDASLYVQGSLDLLLEDEDGTLTLCDYKTDRLRAEDWGAELPVEQRDAAIAARLWQDHGDQLRIYADAVQGMFGKRPDRILIYSLPLGKALELQQL